jgi:hypothetical protein
MDLRSHEEETVGKVLRRAFKFSPPLSAKCIQTPRRTLSLGASGVRRIFDILAHSKDFMFGQVENDSVGVGDNFGYYALEVRGFLKASLQGYTVVCHAAIRDFAACHMQLARPPAPRAIAKPLAQCAGCDKCLDDLPWLRKHADNPTIAPMPGRWICSCCLLVLYCGKRCQKKHFKTHRAVCVPFDCQLVPALPAAPACMAQMRAL